MSKERTFKIRNLIVVVFLSYLTLQVINYFIDSAFYLSLAINFSNRYMLFAFAYFIITLNLNNHQKEAKRFFFLVVVIFIFTITPIGFLVFKLDEHNLNDPSSLLYFSIALYLFSLYTIVYSIKMLKTINNHNEKQISFLPHIIYLFLLGMFILNDFQVLQIPSLVLDGTGLLGAMTIINSIKGFEGVKT